MRGSDRPRGELGAANFRASLSRLVTARPVESVRVYCQGLLAGLSQQDVQTLDCALQPGDRPGPAVSSPDWILSSMQRKPPRISETFVRSNLSGLAALITGATSPGRQREFVELEGGRGECQRRGDTHPTRPTRG
jgi:hypothetical protein